MFWGAPPFTSRSQRSRGQRKSAESCCPPIPPLDGGLARQPVLVYFPLKLQGTVENPPPNTGITNGTKMATLETTIPDDLSRQVHAIARARGIPVHLLVEEALRCIVSPEPFASESEALEEMEALESDVLKDLPWKE